MPPRRTSKFYCKGARVAMSKSTKQRGMIGLMAGNELIDFQKVLLRACFSHFSVTLQQKNNLDVG